MNKINRLVWDPVHGGTAVPAKINHHFSDLKFRVADKRVSQLLLVLHELDESVAGLQGLPETDLSELVSHAVHACGFLDPVEALHAIAVVLKAIEVPEAMLPGS
jgi:hypothetical protein